MSGSTGAPRAGDGGEPTVEATPSDPPRRRGPRRATTLPPAGSDPTPLPEPPRHSSTENDERMRREKPPHY